MKNQNNQPLISIIMPVYNAGDYLTEAIESIRNQTHKDWELIAVDDGSKDKSWKILNKYGKKDKRIKIFRFRAHKGLAPTLNFAIKKAKGNYLARMDADDISHPTRLEKQLQYLTQHKEVILVGSQVAMIDTKGKLIGKKSFPSDHQIIYKMMIEMMPIQHASILAYTKFFKQYLYQNHTTAEDVSIFFKLLTKGKFANTKETLYRYRLHHDSNSLKNPKKTFYLTLKSRIKAIVYWGYKPSVKGVIITILQCLVVSLLPNSFILYLYEAWRFKIPRVIKMLSRKLSLKFAPAKIRLAFPLK